MPSSIEDLLAGLRARRGVVRAALDGAPQALRARRPAPEAWSVDEIVEHLAIVEASIVRMLGRMLREHPAGEAPVGSSRTALDARAVLDRSRRVVATERARPKGGIPAEQSWEELARSRAALERLVREAQGKDLSALQAPHPAFGSLDFLQWVEFVGLHEARHAEQIREAAGG